MLLTTSSNGAEKSAAADLPDGWWNRACRCPDYSSRSAFARRASNMPSRRRQSVPELRARAPQRHPLPSCGWCPPPRRSLPRTVTVGLGSEQASPAQMLDELLAPGTRSCCWPRSVGCGDARRDVARRQLRSGRGVHRGAGHRRCACALASVERTAALALLLAIGACYRSRRAASRLPNGSTPWRDRSRQSGESHDGCGCCAPVRVGEVRRTQHDRVRVISAKPKARSSTGA